jgi:hypothetical protein
MRLTTRWLAWFCLSLMLWTAAAESTHHHPNKTESASCSICVVARSASPTASSTHDQPIFTSFGLLQVEEVTANARFDALDLGIRGPPVI